MSADPTPPGFIPGPPPGFLARRGLLLVLSSPSGAGKSTLTRLLLARDRGFHLSVSVTTRGRRPGEVEGVHYRFLDHAGFETLRERGELLEWAEVHGNAYGTPRGPVEAALREGRDVLFDIDWQGARQLRERAPEDTVGVFVLPPSAAELRGRLLRRAQDSPDVIARRLANARAEIVHWRDYDYVLVNDDLEPTLAKVEAILLAERERRERRPGLDGFAERLVAELDGLVG